MNQEKEVNGMPVWLNSFLEKEFFTKCSVHRNMSDNDTNMYCIDCNLAICTQYCSLPSGSCSGHKLLRIYKHVNQSVVVAKDLKRLIDCSKIQLYKCNTHRVVVLHYSEKKDQQEAETSSACKICKRNIHNPGVFHYCSLQCKVEAFLMKGTATGPPFLKVRVASAAEAEMDTAAEDMVETSAAAGFANQRKNKRKGIPHRAPTN